ncbi:pyrimidine dimer DNA glycosylase/endonuclease V [Paenibacillus yanchengensis]|uniref:Pyrimidine dimer DNA glycosylase/endonuclease V n=1 Tax=Paenibacillus yanchengensis TaxID=2035833 RepID=A0ABW4YMG4_9BACL
MRIWHQSLIQHLPSVKDFKGSSNQLGGQHTEIRMILAMIKRRGKVNHSVVNYVNDHPLSYLYAYGLLIIDEMKQRGFQVSTTIEEEYRQDSDALTIYNQALLGTIIYPEHNDLYLQECLLNLKNKGIVIKYPLFPHQMD